LRAASSSQPE